MCFTFHSFVGSFWIWHRNTFIQPIINNYWDVFDRRYECRTNMILILVSPNLLQCETSRTWLWWTVNYKSFWVTFAHRFLRNTVHLCGFYYEKRKYANFEAIRKIVKATEIIGNFPDANLKWKVKKVETIKFKLIANRKVLWFLSY